MVKLYTHYKALHEKEKRAEQYLNKKSLHYQRINESSGRGTMNSSAADFTL